MARIAALLAWGLLPAAVAAPVAAQVPVEGEFRAALACPAFVGFRSGSNPDGAAVEPGGGYRALGLNREGGEWVRVVVPGARPEERWVELRCGDLATADAGTAGPPRGGRFRPFFDDRPGPDRPDATPPPPPLDAFDRAVLGLCGPWGSRPRAEAFRAMLDRRELAADVEAVRERLGRRLDGGREPTLAGFKDRLTEAWFGADGFAHVFCGEPDGGRGIGGLHYRGRYLQLQEEGLAGPMTPAECLATEVEPPVYTVGVEYAVPGGDGRVGRACPKGYALDLSARDLLVEATEAWKGSRGRGGRQCLEEVGPGGYLAVFVRDRGGAIRTFYPDATPSCDGGGGSAAGCPCRP